MLFDAGIFFQYLRIIVAAIALVLAVVWTRNEFFAGRFFLFDWTVVNGMYVTISVVMDKSIVGFSRFGILLLALVSFSIGMRPAKTPEAPVG